MWPARWWLAECCSQFPATRREVVCRATFYWRLDWIRRCTNESLMRTLLVDFRHAASARRFAGRHWLRRNQAGLDGCRGCGARASQGDSRERRGARTGGESPVTQPRTAAHTSLAERIFRTDLPSQRALENGEHPLVPGRAFQRIREQRS